LLVGNEQLLDRAYA
jgi:hypothetical protein